MLLVSAGSAGDVARRCNHLDRWIATDRANASVSGRAVAASVPIRPPCLRAISNLSPPVTSAAVPCDAGAAISCEQQVIPPTVLLQPRCRHVQRVSFPTVPRDAGLVSK